MCANRLEQGTQKESELARIPAPTNGRHQVIFNCSHRRKEIIEVPVVCGAGLRRFG
jgi:hypothetical protein